MLLTHPTLPIETERNASGTMSSRLLASGALGSRLVAAAQAAAAMHMAQSATQRSNGAQIVQCTEATR